MMIHRVHRGMIASRPSLRAMLLRILYLLFGTKPKGFNGQHTAAKAPRSKCKLHSYPFVFPPVVLGFAPRGDGSLCRAAPLFPPSCGTC